MKNVSVAIGFILIGLAFLAVVGCNQAPGPTAPAGVATAAAAQAPAPADVKPAVARIVFVDQVDCCDCTRNRINKSWDALQTALGNPPSVPVDRIHGDTQSDQAEPYTVFKPIMVMPAIYFVDSNNSVVEMLQGEVRPEQIQAVLGK